ncbi:MAG: hypothetical protein JHC38_03360 [Thiotrichales bacterium]|jgi:hypothetical protein|nr:hypothetical protein [Thiotrichales bacterium]
MSAKLKQSPEPRQFSFDLEHSAEHHYKALHTKQTHTAIVWQARRDDGQQWTKLEANDKTILDFIKSLEYGRDTYLTVNEFYGWRLVRLLRSLRAVYVDIDGQTDLGYVLDELKDAGIPAPGAVIYSGNGLHLYWLLEPTTGKALPVWQKITDKIIDALAHVGADPKAKDCTRVLRLCGTVNSKNGKRVKGLVLDGYYWTLHELADEVLGFREPYKPKIRDIQPARAKAKKKAPTSISGSIYERWYKVLGDLYTIANYHNNNIPDGHRDAWLFLTATALSWFTRSYTLRDEIISAAKTYTTLNDDEIEKVVKTTLNKAEASANGSLVDFNGLMVDPRYKFKRSTLYTWLSDIIPDSLLPDLRAILPDELAEERHRENARKNWQDKYSKNEYTGEGVKRTNKPKQEQALEMRGLGKSTREIASLLGVNQSSVVRWLKTHQKDHQANAPK